MGLMYFVGRDKRIRNSATVDCRYEPTNKKQRLNDRGAQRTAPHEEGNDLLRLCGE
jgi:hypothetical protein